MEASAPTIAPPARPKEGRKNVNTKAVAALVLGVLGLTALPFLGSILALVFGYTASQELDRAPGPDEGQGLALAGVVLGWVGVATAAVAVLAFLAVVTAAYVAQRMGGSPAF